MSRIVVVDDEPDIRLLVQLALRKAGHDVETIADGATAVRVLLGDDPPDLVVLDMRMPEPDGWAVLARLREAGKLDHLRVMAASAHASNGTMNRALDAGCIAYVKKPFLVEDLRETVARVLAAPPGRPLEAPSS